MATGFSNYLADHIQHPSNLVFEELECIVNTTEDSRIVQLLRYRFSFGYMGPVPIPSSEIHPLAKWHLRDLAVYIVKESDHGTMLGLSLPTPFQPWCLLNPFLTRPKKDTTDRRVIMDLSWSHPPGVSVSVPGLVQENAPSFNTEYVSPHSVSRKWCIPVLLCLPPAFT